jgi:hypothetical protein
MVLYFFCFGALVQVDAPHRLRRLGSPRRMGDRLGFSAALPRAIYATLGIGGLCPRSLREVEGRHATEDKAVSMC